MTALLIPMVHLLKFLGASILSSKYT